MLSLKRTEQDLQGGAQFPTGGKVRERKKALIRCNSETDSIVWMEEDALRLFFVFCALSICSGRFLFFWRDLL